MEGTVKFFNRKKGFGFVQGDDGNDYFVHSTALAQGVFLRDNDRVSFEPGEGDRGPKADNVQLLEKGSERTDLPAEEETTEEAAPEAEEPVAEEAPAEETTEEPATEEAPAEETTEEPATEEAPAEETTEEPATEEAPAEEPSEEKKPEEPATE